MVNASSPFGGYDPTMDDASDAPRQPAVPAPPDLPHVDSPPPEEVLDGVPSRDDVVDEARSAAQIVREQPSVEDILGTERR